MAYFSNGTEGMDYEERFCSRCIHNETQPYGCPVINLHRKWNYEQHGDKEKALILNSFIPRDERGNNLQCLMFSEKR